MLEREWALKNTPPISRRSFGTQRRAPQKELTHSILLHPSFFGPQMTSFLEAKLYADVEGTCSGRFGYIIAVVSILDIGKGMVMSGSGQVCGSAC